jgi:hypothetical protein
MPNPEAGGWSLIEFFSTILLAAAASLIGLVTGHKVHEGELKHLRDMMLQLHAENAKQREEDRAAILRLEAKLDRAVEQLWRRD